MLLREQDCNNRNRAAFLPATVEMQHLATMMWPIVPAIACQGFAGHQETFNAIGVPKPETLDSMRRSGLGPVDIGLWQY